MILGLKQQQLDTDILMMLFDFSFIFQFTDEKDKTFLK